MKKTTKNKFWLFLIAIMALMVIQASSVSAIIAKAEEYIHTVNVILRFKSELAYPTPAGRHYISLLYKHDREFSTFIEKYPDHTLKLMEITTTFTPGTEALLEGKGDTVRITEDQIRRLETELEWMATIASPSLKEDIERETQRYPLENFIGMTMSEAWAYMQSDFPSEPYIPPAPTLIPFDTCHMTPEPGFLEKQNLVPDSNGQWAYYVLGGVYFEYPSSWHLERRYIEYPGCKTHYSVFVEEGMSNVDLPIFYIANLVGESDFDSMLKKYIAPEETLLWTQPINATGFQGIKILSYHTDSGTIVYEVVLYNKDNQAVFYSCIYLYEESVDSVRSSPEAVMEKYPELQRIIESVRIWEP